MSVSNSDLMVALERIDGKVTRVDERLSAVEDWKKWASRFAFGVLASGVAGGIFGVVLK